MRTHNRGSNWPKYGNLQKKHMHEYTNAQTDKQTFCYLYTVYKANQWPLCYSVSASFQPIAVKLGHVFSKVFDWTHLALCCLEDVCVWPSISGCITKINGSVWSGGHQPIESKPAKNSFIDQSIFIIESSDLEGVSFFDINVGDSYLSQSVY